MATVERIPDGESEKALALKGQATPPDIPLTKRGVDLQTFEQLRRFAHYVVLSGLAPKGMEKVESVVVAVNWGLELGLTPMSALQNIAVINGRPAVWGDALKALVINHPDCEEFEEWFEGEPYKDDYRAICRIVRKGKETIDEFSVADAKLAGLWGKRGKEGQPTPWITHPKRMLKFRARGFVCRDVFPDVLKGLYTAEEVEDIIDVTPSPVAGKKSGKLDALADRIEKATETTAGGDPAYDPGAILNAHAEAMRASMPRDDEDDMDAVDVVAAPMAAPHVPEPPTQAAPESAPATTDPPAKKVSKRKAKLEPDPLMAPAPKAPVPADLPFEPDPAAVTNPTETHVLIPAATVEAPAAPRRLVECRADIVDLFDKLGFSKQDRTEMLVSYHVGATCIADLPEQAAMFLRTMLRQSLAMKEREDVA